MSSLWRITLDTNPEDCNLHCIMCEEHSPYSTYIRDKLGGKRRRMPREWLEPIFQQAHRLGVMEIIPSTMGEPLLYKHIDHFIELCYKYNIKMNLTTNGTFPKTLRKTVTEWAELLVPITSDIKISWNGATPQVAESIMKGIRFEEIIKNVKTLIEFRNDHWNKKGHYCRISFQLTFMQNNMHELPDIVRLAADLGVDRVKGHHLWVHFDEIRPLSIKSDLGTIEKWNQYVQKAYEYQDKYRKPDGSMVLLENIYYLEHKEHSLTEVPEHYECPFLKRELWISATGKISPCCAPDELRDSLGYFGNIQDTTLEQVLQSEAYQNLVMNYKNIPLCKNCNMRKPK